MERLVLAAQQLFGVHLTGRQVAALTTFENVLLAWNENFNLTAIRDTEGIHTKHFLDSFSCTLAWKRTPPKRLIDVGTGAGFPGIPLKILYPFMELTLVESVGKKTSFCRHAINILNLEAVEVMTMRAEEVGQMPGQRESYDWAVARAVANLPVLAEYLLPLVKLGGSMLAQKGHNGLVEAHNAEKAFRLLGGRLRHLIPVTLPGVAEERYLVVVEKIAATPAQYPRKPGFPAKSPL
jgi:16S rRNA (guanine527-N7)-methyltransferase